MKLLSFGYYRGMNLDIPARDDLLISGLASGGKVEDLAVLHGVEPEVVRRVGVARGILVEAGTSGFRQVATHFVPTRAAEAVLDRIGWDLDARLGSARPRCSTRDAALCESVILEDVTLEEAGRRVPVTRERMRQILLRHTGLATQHLKAYREQLREARRLALGIEKVRILAATDREMDVVELGRRSGLSSDEVREELGTRDVLRRLRKNTWTVGADDASILEEIRRVAGLPGGSPLSGPFYEEHRRRNLPGSVRVVQRFSTWSEACRRAGIRPVAAIRSDYQRRWTTEDLLHWVRAYLQEVGAAATYAGMSSWLKARSTDGAPSAQTIRNSVGTWTEVLDLALMERLAPMAPDTEGRSL